MTEKAGQLLKHEWAKLLLTNLVTLVGAVLTCYALLSQSNSDAYKATIDRMDSMQAQLLAANLRIVELEAEIRQNEDRESVLQNYIDSVPFPMWIKVKRDDGKFEMYMINNAYVYQFRVTKREYEGRTDYDFWPHDVAKEFEKNDLKVISSGGFMKAREKVPSKGINGGRSEATWVWKWKIDLPDGMKGVGGFLIPEVELAS